MRIVFCATHTRAGPWIDALRRALPDALIDEWSPGAPQADHAVVWAPPQQFFDEQPALRAIFNMGAGVDALLGLRLPEHALLVRLDDAGMSVQMAEFVCHAVIRHFREFDVYEAEQANANWAFRKPRERNDCSVGVMGLGVLGQRVAHALSVFEYPLRGWSRSARNLSGIDCFAGAAQFDEFLAGSQVLVCLLPLTHETRHILNRETLARLPAGAYLINAARGEHLVERDLIELLDAGHLSGAALDVFRDEPLPRAHPFWTHPKISVTPHTSARTLRGETVAQIAAKIEALQRGEPIRGIVDRVRGY